MDKDILVMPRTDLTSAYLALPIMDPKQVYAEVNTRGLAMDRAAAEQDPTFKQVIPYIVIGTTHEDGRTATILGAMRLRGGNEARLHGGITLGFGGHVKYLPGLTPMEMVKQAAEEELREELKINVSFNQLSFRGVLYNDLDEVGRVHTGLMFFLDLSAHAWSELMTLQTGEPDKLELFWTTPQLAEHLTDRLEAWAKLALSVLQAHDVAAATP